MGHLVTVNEFLGGVEATRPVKQISPHSQIIVLISYPADEYIFPALRAGALSSVLKDVGPEELAEAVRKAASRSCIRVWRRE